VTSTAYTVGQRSIIVLLEIWGIHPVPSSAGAGSFQNGILIEFLKSPDGWPQGQMSFSFENRYMSATRSGEISAVVIAQAEPAQRAPE
jgi:hypothetical protein